MKYPLHLLQAFAIAVTASLAAAQGVAVPPVDCILMCPHQHDNDPCCITNWLSCIRYDSPAVIDYPGDLIVIPHEDFEFRCPNCCKFEPDECPGNSFLPNPRECEISPSISYTESIDLSISSSVTIGIKPVEVKLESAVGVQKGAEVHVELRCPLLTPKCMSNACKPRIEVRENRKAHVDHTWQAVGRWITDPDCSTPCPIAGNKWIIGPGACLTATSYAVGDGILLADCGQIYQVPCPPRIPCE